MYTSPDNHDQRVTLMMVLCLARDTSNDNCVWYSISFGSDMLQLEDLRPGDYFVGVFGYSVSEFSITISIDRITLIDGTPSTMTLAGHAHQ